MVRPLIIIICLNLGLALVACTEISDRKSITQRVEAQAKHDTAVNDPFPFAPSSARVERRPDGPRAADLAAPTQVVVLGTGTPVPDAYRAGASIAVIHKGEAYIFDAGAGTQRRAVEARYKYDIPALYPSQIKAVFITHLHSDHIVDLSEFALTYWWRRDNKLLAYGPRGLKGYFDGMVKMMEADITLRTDGTQPVRDKTGYIPIIEEIEPGIIFQTDGLSIEAFPVPHGSINPAFGYKIVTDDLSIIISGDTSYSEMLTEKANGVDLLFHEAASDKGLAKLSDFWKSYMLMTHTLASDVGKIANIAQPKKLIFYHTLNYGAPEQAVVDSARENFNGEILLANDLDYFVAGE